MPYLYFQEHPNVKYWGHLNPLISSIKTNYYQINLVCMHYIINKNFYLFCIVICIPYINFMQDTVSSLIERNILLVE